VISKITRKLANITIALRLAKCVGVGVGVCTSTGMVLIHYLDKNASCNLFSGRTGIMSVAADHHGLAPRIHMFVIRSIASGSIFQQS
jgi:hypothetical protein